MPGGDQETGMLAGWAPPSRGAGGGRARGPGGGRGVAGDRPRGAARAAGALRAVAAVTSAPGAGGRLAAGARAMPWAAAAMRAAAPGATMVSRPGLGTASRSVFMAPMTLEAVCMEMPQRFIISRWDG